MKFPDNKTFAFTILDDTDDATLENVRPVYECLQRHGLRTTKTVWPVDCPEGSRIFFAADTLQRKEYLNFVHKLAKNGFEVAFHGATMETSRRARTIEALEFLKGEFGCYPTLFCNHGFNRDNLYWGPKRFQTTVLRYVMGMLSCVKRAESYGEVEDSEFFWGDVCQKHVRYVRNFTFSCLNMMEVNPDMPYRLAGTPYVNGWFSTADAPDAAAFVQLLSDEKLDTLEQSGGVCIVSTHLGKGFTKNGVLDAQVERILSGLGQRPGWYVPVTKLLDYLSGRRGQGRRQYLGPWKTAKLEMRFLLDKVFSA